MHCMSAASAAADSRTARRRKTTIVHLEHLQPSRSTPRWGVCQGWPRFGRYGIGLSSCSIPQERLYNCAPASQRSAFFCHLLQYQGAWWKATCLLRISFQLDKSEKSTRCTCAHAVPHHQPSRCSGQMGRQWPSWTAPARLYRANLPGRPPPSYFVFQMSPQKMSPRGV